MSGGCNPLLYARWLGLICCPWCSGADLQAALLQFHCDMMLHGSGGTCQPCFACCADPYSAPDIDIGQDDAGTAAKVATVVVTGLGFSATAIIGTAYGLYREVRACCAC